VLATPHDEKEDAMPLRSDTIGVCPAILVPDPLTPRDESFEGALRAAVAAGFDAFSLWSFWPTAYGIERARDLLDSLGATVPAVEAATQWARGPKPATAEAAGLVTVATQLGSHTIAACCLEPDVESFGDAVAGFRALCDAAGVHDMRVCIEFLPCTGMPDLATAWRVVEESGAANGGILLDMMHWHRQSGGPDVALLERIPGDRIHYVQVCDTVTAEAEPGAYMEEAMGDRRLPGDGDVDIARLLSTLERIDADPWFAYEVFNQQLAGEGAEAMASRLAACRTG
jgi:sugar phosphate isomerase/epimerase